MGRVAGKVALVAGAGGGIGGAAAEALAREGAAVLCTDIDGATAEATAGQIRAAGGRAAAQLLDVCHRAAVDAAADRRPARPDREPLRAWLPRSHTAASFRADSTA